MLNKKTKQIQDMAEEKGTQAGEIHDLKDMLDVKERKVNVLQKKVRCRHSEVRVSRLSPVLIPTTELGQMSRFSHSSVLFFAVSN